MKATISADIVNSTHLNKDEIVALSSHLQNFLRIAESLDDGCWGRVVRGDGIECALNQVTRLMRLVLLLKFHVKTFNGLNVRIAAAIGNLRTNDRELGIIDGEAIYDSGRALAAMSDGGRETLVITSRVDETKSLLQTLFSLVDYIADQATPKQSQVVVMKLQRVPDCEIANRLHVTRSNITVHLRRSGWSAIEKALTFFEEVF